MLRIIATVLAASLLWAIPASAQPKMEIDYRRIANCQAYRDFVKAYGSPAELAAGLAQKQREYCIPARPRPDPIAREWRQIGDCRSLEAFAARYGRLRYYRSRIPAKRSQYCKPSPPPSPAPRAPSPGAYLSGWDMLDLYRDNYFCYKYESGNSCSDYEELYSFNDGRLTLRKYLLFPVPASKVPLWATRREPNMRLTLFQTLTPRADGLCWDQSARVAAASFAEGSVYTANHSYIRPFTGPALGDLRGMLSQIARQNSTRLICSRYRRVSGSVIAEDAFDGDEQYAFGDRIVLIPRGEYQPVLRLTTDGYGWK